MSTTHIGSSPVQPEYLDEDTLSLQKLEHEEAQKIRKKSPSKRDHIEGRRSPDWESPGTKKNKPAWDHRDDTTDWDPTPTQPVHHDDNDEQDDDNDSIDFHNAVKHETVDDVVEDTEKDDRLERPYTPHVHVRAKEMEEPRYNFVASPTDGHSRTGYTKSMGASRESVTETRLLPHGGGTVVEHSGGRENKSDARGYPSSHPKHSGGTAVENKSDTRGYESGHPKHGGTAVEKRNDRSEKTSGHPKHPEPEQSREGSGTLLLTSQKTNRVHPAEEEAVQRPRPQSQQQYASNLERKQSFVIGADDNTDGPGCCGWLLYIFSILLVVITLPFSLIFCIKVVQEYERAVIFRLGRLPLGGAKGPGIFFIIPCIESYTKVDLRTVSFDVPPQEVLTKDSVTVSVDAVVYYRVSNPTVSVANVENAHHSTRLLAQTTLRNILGTKDMSEILSDRESISHGMQSTLDNATDKWGIKVERVEIKDVRLPVQLQRAMAAEAEAAREARAKVIAAEGEHKASHALKEAADVMSDSSAALQLRYLQTLSSISAEKNSTIIFPLPIDMLRGFLHKK